MERTNLEHRSLSAQVADELEKRIGDGVWPIGSRIPSEAELMEMFHVSRNTLREAIRYLMIVGMVDVRPGDGTYVLTSDVFHASIRKRVEKEQQANVLETRRILEPKIVELAAQRGTREECDELGNIYQRAITSYQAGAADYLDYDRQFHTQIARMCHNPLLFDLYKAIAEFLPVFFKQGLFAFQFGDSEFFLHQDLLRMVQQGQADQARQYVERMLQKEIEVFQELSII